MGCANVRVYPALAALLFSYLASGILVGLTWDSSHHSRRHWSWGCWCWIAGGRRCCCILYPKMRSKGQKRSDEVRRGQKPII